MSKNEARWSKKFWVSILFGILSMLLIVLAATGIGATLISNGKISEDAAMQTAFISAYIGAAIGALIAKKLNGGKMSFQISMLSAAGCVFLRLLISAMSLQDGLFSKSDLTIMACILCGGLTSAILGTRRRKKRRG